MTSPQHDRLLDVATSFFLAGERLAPDMKFGFYGLHSVGAPRVSNYAIAIEIALKLIAEITGRPNLKGRDRHNLHLLYINLRASTRKLLRDHMPGASTPRRLSDVLRANSNAFVEWRYSYEHALLVSWMGDLRHIFIACYRTIRALSSTTSSIYEKNWGNFAPDDQWAWYEMEVRSLERA